MTLVRQYLDNYDEMNREKPEATAVWIRDNQRRIEELLTGPEAVHSCRELTALAKVLAIKYFGPPKSE